VDGWPKDLSPALGIDLRSAMIVSEPSIGMLGNWRVNSPPRRYDGTRSACADINGSQGLVGG